MLACGSGKAASVEDLYESPDARQILRHGAARPGEAATTVSVRIIAVICDA